MKPKAREICFGKGWLKNNIESQKQFLRFVSTFCANMNPSITVGRGLQKH